MPSFQTVSHAGAIKPGAAVLASVQSPEGETLPGLVAQQFGRGRAAAMAVGDLWRWNLHRKPSAESDLEKAWRQTVRWLVAEADVEARELNGTTIVGQRLVLERGLHPDWRT